MKNSKILILPLLILFTSATFAQISVPPEKRGDRKYRKEGIHNGNLVETLFYNFGEVAWWGREPSGVWPRGSRHSYMDGITPIVAAQVVDASGDTIRMVEAGYRENMDVSPSGVERGFQPRPGYANPNQSSIAMSDKPITWPLSWPGKDDSWNGFWDGYFGKITNADQESYFVMDDNSDDGHNFYPDSTDHTRRGLGLSVKVRGFQWSNILAEDLIFWHYEITNEGTHNYNQAIFGMYVDCGVGGQFDSNDDYASFNKDDDITYSWDHDGIGEGGWSPTGYAGYAFLESPGNPNNFIDDDGDGENMNPVIEQYMLEGEIAGNGIDDNGNGIIDESTFNIGMKYADGIDNDNNGVIDEMIDEARSDGIDNNGNWDASIDDVGLDGLAGTGDYGEGDGKPTSGWLLPGSFSGMPDGPVNKYGLADTGQPGEPNIDKTDINESDQIGLTAFDVFYIGSGVTFREDDRIWERISYSHFDTDLQNGNIAFLFGSGPFILPSGATERFSLGLLFGNDLNDIVRNKETVQNIYDNNYRFAQPPLKPKVSAAATDGKVTLYWDSDAEQSYDSFLKEYDFEGYKIYRSTDPGFQDAYTITSGYGDNTLYKPVAQFDIINDVGGFFDLDYQGVKYYLGDNKGLKHSWTDSEVMNGQTYYYAVVSYDRGNAGIGLYPSECTKVIVRDLAGNVTLDVNTAQVTPGTASAGYVSPAGLDTVYHAAGNGTGTILTEVVNPDLVGDKEYLISFAGSSADTTLYSVYEIASADTIPLIQNSPYTDGEDFNELIDGIRVLVFDDSVEFDYDNSGWTNGNSNVIILGEKTYDVPAGIEDYPVSYEVRVGQPDSSWLYGYRNETDFQVWDVYNKKKVKYYHWEPADAADRKLNAGDYFDVWKEINGVQKRIWRFSLIAPTNAGTINPSSGDLAKLTIKTPFSKKDKYTFYAVKQKIDLGKAKEELDKVTVVPNPYVGAARWEPQRLTASGRTERRIYFTRLPNKATIRIYTISGDWVATINHESNLLDGKASWNLKSNSGLDVAPGVYVYHLEAPGVGEKIGRFAIIK
ncbi:MAG: hypothetical protein GXO87_04200 [Chlorobi bacterium]|nr:hypothetical protein [Chlorobiota bacterium]